MVNLTNKLVASVKPPRDKKYIRLWDDSISGFGLRVTDNGVKSFIFEGRQFLSKKTKQVKIGRVGQMSVSEARASAAELSRLFRSGDRVRGTAAQALLDRGFGKPKADIQNTNTDFRDALEQVQKKLSLNKHII